MLSTTSAESGRASSRVSRSGRAGRAGLAKQTAKADRDALMAQHLGLVHHVARRLATHLSTAVELDELVSAGMLGLVQAVNAFDARRGLSFSTYAVPRIRGAILDELRKQDHVPRNVRRRARTVARARETLGSALRRSPSEAELSQHLNIDHAVLRKWELDAEGAAISSFDQPLRADPAGATLADTMMDERVASVDDLLTHEQEVRHLRSAIEFLKEQERTVLALNFFEELKLQDIAVVMGLSVCRISQIRSAALAKLRIALSDLRAA